MLRASNYILIALTLVACRKDPQENNPDTGPVYPPPPEYVETPGFPDCSLDLEDAWLDYEDNDPSWGNNYHFVTNADTSLVGFRVSTLDENRLLLFVSYRQSRYAYLQRMAVYNMVTGTYKPVADHALGYQDIPDWNAEERIVFTGTDLQIYSVNPDGSALSRLTTSSRNTYPLWAPDGSRIFFHQFNPSTGTRLNLICDKDGRVEDTVQTQWIRFSDWVRNDLLLLGGAYSYRDMNKGKDFEYGQTDDAAYSMTMSVLGELVFVSMAKGKIGDLMAFNIGTEELRKVKPACKSNLFRGIGYAPGKNKLIVMLCRFVKTGPEQLKTEYDLYLMDVDGGSPQLIKTFH